MADNDQQDQGQGTSTESAQEPSSQPSQQASGDQGSEHWVPKHRFDELNKRMKESEERERKIIAEREQEQEDRQQKQGEYQQLAEKRKKDLDKEKADHAETKSAWQRERRLNTWYQGASGIIKPGKAMDTAFNLLSEDDFSNIDDTDPAAYKQLAQNLIEMHDYLAVEGPRGAGSGGSRAPVMVGENSASKVGGKQVLFKGPKRKSWK